MIAIATKRDRPKVTLVEPARVDKAGLGHQMKQLPNELARARIPQAHFSVEASRGHESAVGRELALDHVMQVALELVLDGECVRVPDEHLSIRAARAEQIVGGRPVTGVHGADVSPQRFVHVAVVVHVPEFDGGVSRRTGQLQRAALGEFEIAHQVIVVEEAEQELAVERIVDAYLARGQADR